MISWTLRRSSWRTASVCSDLASRCFTLAFKSAICSVFFLESIILDNDFNTLEYNSLNTSINYKNLSTSFNFIEEDGAIGDTNTIANKTSVKFNDENYLTFNTRRNRKIDLTEYYNLIYEYKNDCLIAGVKYNKSYYEDRDLKPSENLLFSITLTPLTSFEQKIDQ